MVEELSLVISNPNRGEFLKEISWNKAQFMDKVASITEQYRGLTYTEDQMKSAKEDRAMFNAMKKTISDRRIEVKKAVMAPYTQFEREVNEVVVLIDEQISMIDSQIKEYEERVKAEKKQKLEEFFREMSGEYDFLTFDIVFEQRYLNVSVSLNKAKEDIRQKVERIATDFRSIEAFTSEKYRGAAKDVYMRTLNLSDALAEDKRLTEIDLKQEKERLRREEAERRREQEAQAFTKEKPEIPIGKAISSIEHQTFAGSVSGDATVTDPFVSQEDTKQYKASFTIYGTRAQIMAVKQYMIDNNIKFGKVEK